MKSTPNIDPIFGVQDRKVLPFTKGVKKHGSVIENSLLRVINSSSDWEAFPQFYIPGRKKRFFFDQVVYNKKSKIIIVIECKRQLSEISSPYKEKILRDVRLTIEHANDLAFFCYATLEEVEFHFLIFDAYGTHADDFVCGQRVIRPKDLPDLFCDCVSLGWKAIEKEVFNTCKRNKQNININYGERVSNYLDFSKLKQSTQIRACLENQSRKNYKEILDKYSTPLSIP